LLSDRQRNGGNLKGYAPQCSGNLKWASSREPRSFAALSCATRQQAEIGTRGISADRVIKSTRSHERIELLLNQLFHDQKANLPIDFVKKFGDKKSGWTRFWQTCELVGG
jgi:hypothetical protein